MKTKTLTIRTLQALVVAAAFSLTAAAYAAPNETSHQTVGEHVDDATLTTKVKSEFVGTHNLTSTHIHVHSRNGEVRLTGSVPTAEERSLATQAATSVQGVRKVNNNLRVNAHPDKTWFHHKKEELQSSNQKPSTFRLS